MVEGLIPWCGELDTFQLHQSVLFSHRVVKTSLGDLSGVGTPGPIPNPVVKHVSADGTWRATSRESRSLPRGFSFNISSCIIKLTGLVEGRLSLVIDNTRSVQPLFDRKVNPAFLFCKDTLSRSG